MDELPIATRKAKIALWTGLALSLAVLPFSLINFGIATLFVGPAAAFMAVIHISTHLIIIHIREKRASRKTPIDPHRTQLPPTSTLPSIIFTCILVMIFTAAFIVSTLIMTSDVVIFHIIMVLVPFETTFEGLSAIALVWLMVVGIKERRRYLKVARGIKLDDISST